MSGRTMGDKRVVGRCSLCGGVVSAPLVFWSVTQPVPQCETCGAYADQAANLPVVPMTPKTPWVRPSQPSWFEKASATTTCTQVAPAMAETHIKRGRYVGREC